MTVLPPVVDAAAVAAHLADHRSGGRPVVVCDVRSTMATAAPTTDADVRHVPGAVVVSLEDDLSGAPAPVAGRHPLPSPDELASALGRAGIGADAVVFAFDDRGGAFAARLVWMLRVIGQDAALVDGGGAAVAGLALGTDPPAPATRPAVDWPAGAAVDADAVQAAIDAGSVVVDSRDAARYAGEVEPIDAVAGHVPGAINVPFGGNLDHAGRFLAPTELAARFTAAGVDGDAIVYCGSGVTACHNALAVEHAGLGRPAVYVGSWSGWSTDPDRPVATGSTPRPADR